MQGNMKSADRYSASIAGGLRSVSEVTPGGLHPDISAGRYCTLFFILLLTLPAVAQGQQLRLKPLLKTAKEAVKNSKEQEQAEEALLQVVDSQAVTGEQRAQIYYLCEELQRTQHEQENLNLYLKQPYDTLKFFSTILKMHQYAMECDSVEVAEGHKPKYRSKGRSMMLRERDNLLNGGKWLLRGGKYADAFPYFDTYLRVPYLPMMGKDSTSLRADTLLPRVAYWATIAAYRAEEPVNALKYIDLAIEGADRRTAASLYEYKTNCYHDIGDTVAWFTTFVQGVRLFPAYDYFYLHLMDYFDRHRRYDEGIALSDSIIRVVGDRDIYWYGMSQMYLGKGDYDSTIVCADKTIALDHLFADAYYNKGVAYLNKAITFAKTMDTDVKSSKGRQDRTTLAGLYQYAREPMELFRALAPREKEKWARSLYVIYLNLNLGDEFAEIERVLDEK